MTATARPKRRRRKPAPPEAPRAPFILRKLGTMNVLSEAGLEQIEANADQILA